METEKWNIDLDAIALSTTNEMFRRPREITDDALAELAASIVQLGVIQPISVRPNPQVQNGYILISGERRFRASRLAGKTDIPAYVRDVSEETAFEMQMTENIEREDIHPLNQARGYRRILETNQNLTTGELAARFGKSESYVLQRLKLNELVREGKRDFYADKMNLGHALILARLMPQDQRSAIEAMNTRHDGYGTVNELQEFVAQNIINSLSAAPFDKNDDELYKKAGACINCPKRSGASPLLFAEIKEKDKCFDRNCFFIKCQRFLVNRTKEIIETRPDVLFLTGYYEPEEAIIQLLADHKIKALKEYNDFSEHNNGGAKAKGLWIAGNKAGHIVTVFLTKPNKELSSDGPPHEKEMIEKIRQRIARGKELDREKVYAKIIESLYNHATQKKDHHKKLMAAEEIMLWYIVLDKAGYALKKELMKFIGITTDRPEKLYDLLRKMKQEEKAYLLRKVMLDQYGGNYPDSNQGYIIQQIAAGYGDIDILGFENEQKEVREKRETRAKEKITELQKSKSKNAK